ncbi:MAG: hypothetical protein MJE77_06700 [Proteobacteria bacterium]|nr:hypothetical protein [Pseudomonadota bacterium]
MRKQLPRTFSKLRLQAVLAGMTVVLVGFGVSLPDRVDASGIYTQQATTVGTGALGLDAGQVAYLSVSDIGLGKVRTSLLQLSFIDDQGTVLKSQRIALNGGKTAEITYHGATSRIPVRATVALAQPADPVHLVLTFAIATPSSQPAAGSTEYTEMPAEHTDGALSCAIASRGPGDPPPGDVFGPCAAEPLPIPDPV